MVSELFKEKTTILSIATIVVSATLLLGPAIPFAHAYGPAQWQTAFSGTSSNPATHSTNGFWGWCDFAASAPDGQSGTDADCQVATYFFNGTGASTGNLLHMSVKGTAWSMQPSTFPPVPGLPANDFFITDGSMSITGPFVVKFISQLPGPVPPGCSLVGQTATCPLSFWESVHLYSPDTGVPAAPGHYSFANLLEAVGVELPPGTHINIQVNQLP
jgi:hypothetical protein